MMTAPRETLLQRFSNARPGTDQGKHVRASAVRKSVASISAVLSSQVEPRWPVLPATGLDCLCVSMYIVAAMRVGERSIYISIYTSRQAESLARVARTLDAGCGCGRGCAEVLLTCGSRATSSARRRNAGASHARVTSSTPACMHAVAAAAALRAGPEIRPSFSPCQPALLSSLSLSSPIPPPPLLGHV